MAKRKDSAKKIDAERQRIEQIEIDLEQKFVELKDAEKKFSEQPKSKEFLEEVERIKDDEMKLKNAKYEKDEKIEEKSMFFSFGF
ncbi:hypothetical protein B9Z55_028233 [Caenorhabditis nigoni]|uniref:Uncharacterized protein n=1 Tax=Caenorhabditis nigoni TaxID=1611254 RepID=A0A2G5SCH5_9PELO|nr:hypothetical protein B9Z55_028233 [Caenorhabditis nigoni]